MYYKVSIDTSGLQENKSTSRGYSGFEKNIYVWLLGAPLVYDVRLKLNVRFVD